jgi:uncharacterized phage protein (TIGR01671 family)
MRENIGIFRGKRVDTGQWKEGYLLGLQDKISGKDLFFIVDEMGEYHRVDPETVGEFTGMTDKDGTGIFEGDVCHFYGGDSYSGFWEYDLVREVKIDFDCIALLENLENIEVLGNIHDNPELIGDKDT